MELSNFQPAVGCTVVFGGQKADREQFAEAFAADHPDICYRVLPALRDYKKPFLGKHKPLWKVLCQDLKKDDRKDTLTLLDLYARYLGDNLLDRAPTAMSRGQQLFWSHVFRAIRGERFFLLRDDNAPLSRETAARLVCWLRNNFESVRVVWVTSATREQLTQPFWTKDDPKLHCHPLQRDELESLTPLAVAGSFWQLQDGTVAQIDLSTPEKPRHRRRPQPETVDETPVFSEPKQPEPAILQESAQDCFQAAQRCLGEDDPHGCPEDALPYIQKLLALMDQGDPDAGRYVISLNRLNPEISGRAWQAYQSKK